MSGEAQGGMEIYLDRIKTEERYKVFMGLVVPRPIAFVSTRADDGIVGPTLRIDQAKLDAVGRMGGNSYTRTNKGLFIMERPDTEAVLVEYRKAKN